MAGKSCFFIGHKEAPKEIVQILEDLIVLLPKRLSGQRRGIRRLRCHFCFRIIRRRVRLKKLMVLTAHIILWAWKKFHAALQLSGQTAVSLTV